MKIRALNGEIFDQIPGSYEKNASYAPSAIDVSDFISEYAHQMMREEEARIQKMIREKKTMKNPRVERADRRSSLIADGFKEWSSLAQNEEVKETTEKPNEVTLPPGKTAISVLQEMMQKRGASVPIYKTKGGAGPPFTIVCQIEDMRYSEQSSLSLNFVVLKPREIQRRRRSIEPHHRCSNSFTRTSTELQVLTG